jgi:hypothetical protein
MVSIQLVSPTSGEGTALGNILGLEIVSIQLVSPTSGEPLTHQPRPIYGPVVVSIQLVSPTSGENRER